MILDFEVWSIINSYFTWVDNQDIASSFLYICHLFFLSIHLNVEPIDSAGLGVVSSTIYLSPPPHPRTGVTSIPGFLQGFLVSKLSSQCSYSNYWTNWVVHQFLLASFSLCYLKHKHWILLLFLIWHVFFSFFHIGSHGAQPNPELLVLLPLALKGWDHHYVLPCLALFLMSYLSSEQTYSLNTQLPHFIYYWSPLTSNIQWTKTACLWGDCNF